MKNYSRNYPLFSLCGLNCGLCPIHNMNNGCPGCGGGEGHQSCSIIKCSINHGSPEFCYLCKHFPCDKYNDIDIYDSFILHRNQMKDILKVQKDGISNYIKTLDKKIKILKYLLDNFNMGRQKSFFALL